VSVAAGDGVEGALDGGVGSAIVAAPGKPRPGPAPQAIVDAGVDLDHVELPAQEIDGRQEQLALQAVRIEALRRIVGGDAEQHAGVEQGLHQAAQHHGVGDVGDVEFVEAHQPRFAGDAGRHLCQRVGFIAVGAQRLVHLAHEGVEMHAALAIVGHGGEEAVHQEALAAPYPAPEPDAARQFGTGQELPQLAAPRRLEREQTVIELLQALRGDLLRGIGLDAALGQRGVEAFDHAVFGDVEDLVGHANQAATGGAEITGASTSLSP
jgi:hypothetical protein